MDDHPARGLGAVGNPVLVAQGQGVRSGLLGDERRRAATAAVGQGRRDGLRRRPRRLRPPDLDGADRPAGRDVERDPAPFESVDPGRVASDRGGSPGIRRWLDPGRDRHGGRWLERRDPITRARRLATDDPVRHRAYQPGQSQREPASGRIGRSRRIGSGRRRHGDSLRAGIPFGGPFQPGRIRRRADAEPGANARRDGQVGADRQDLIARRDGHEESADAVNVGPGHEEPSGEPSVRFWLEARGDREQADGE